MSAAGAEMATAVVAWQRAHGRQTLPWQVRDPYRVWLSEIMLQQTQVATVLPYYARFLEAFPDVRALAAAPQEAVMALWSGLGYYSRARNLHRCAQQVVSEHGGEFPRSAEVLAQLPGIGRSTAGAIASFCFSERVPILDANVRRVLTRYLGFAHDLAQARNERLLWEAATQLLPTVDLHEAMPRYTQGMMDLGAMVCLPRQPQCDACPLQGGCVAAREGDPERYPVRTKKLKRKSEAWWLLVLQDGQGRIWLHRRPQSGIWAGLYAPPVFASAEEAQAACATLRATQPSLREVVLEPSLHVLTHRDLHLHPWWLTAREGEGWTDAVLEALAPEGQWFTPAQWPALGLPTPVRKLLEQLHSPLWLDGF